MVKQPTAEYPGYFFEQVTKSWRRRYVAGVRRRQPFSWEAAGSRGRQQVLVEGSRFSGEAARCFVNIFQLKLRFKGFD